MIPKIIHYCWLGGDLVPDRLHKCMETWKRFLPDYKFMLWDKNQFDIHSVKWVEQACNAKKYAFASDYIRLYAIYNYGGIYMDMDMELIQPFKPDLFSHGLNLGLEPGGGIEGAFIAGEKGHPIIKQLMNIYESLSFIRENGSMRMFVINYFIQKVLSDYGYVADEKGQILDSCNTRLYNVEYFNCRSLLTGRIHKTVNSYIIHWHTIMWANRKTRIIAWIRIHLVIPIIGESNYSKVRRYFKRDSAWFPNPEEFK